MLVDYPSAVVATSVSGTVSDTRRRLSLRRATVWYMPPPPSVTPFERVEVVFGFDPKLSHWDQLRTSDASILGRCDVRSIAGASCVGADGHCGLHHDGGTQWWASIVVEAASAEQAERVARSIEGHLRKMTA